MSVSSVSVYRSLSLKARLAVALVCFERFCAKAGLHHPELTVFFEHMWALPSADSFPAWDSHKDGLVGVGLGDPFSPAIISLLDVSGVPQHTLRELLMHTVEIVFGSAYGQSDDTGSLQDLEAVLRITSGAGVVPPPAQSFSSSLFSEREGWGAPVSPQTATAWRYSSYDA